jgi:SAM-dependent methyltransferase
LALAALTPRWLGAASVALLAIGAVPAGAQTPDVMFVPTNIDVALGMLHLAAVGQGDVVYDLGSGDGRLVIAAAQRYGARGVGIDIDASLVAEATHNADTAGVADRVKFRKADLFQSDLREATVVTLYLTPSLNLRLRPKLFRELRPGARVVSNNFDMDDWQPDSSIIVKGVALANTPVRLWIIPADVRGAWKVMWDALPPLQLRLQQRFQQVTGSATIPRPAVALADVRLRGDSLHFTVPAADGRGAMRFDGRVAGDSAGGRVTVEGSATTRIWRAARVGGGG